MLNNKNECYMQEFTDKSNYFQQRIMEEVKSNLGNGKYFIGFFLGKERGQRMIQRQRKYKTYPHAHGPSVCSIGSILRGTEKNLNHDCSLASQ